jgi:type IV secretory pathway VirB4 component
LILDYHSEMGRLVQAYGGLAVELADSALNPFSVVSATMTLEQRELLKEAVSILAADRLPNGQRGLTPEEESWLSEAMDWFIDEWIRRSGESPPLLEDFIRLVGEAARSSDNHLPVMDEKVVSDFLLRLRTWTQGRKGQTFNRHTTLDLTANRLICLGMRRLRSSISTENLYGPIAIVMALFYQELTKYGPNEGWLRNRGYTMHLVVDEAHLAFDDPMLGPALERFSREVRKYGGGVLAASQALEDFLNIRYSRVFLENAGTRLFLGVTPRTRELVQKVSGLEDWELDFLIQRADRGFGALIAGQEKAMVQITPHELLVRKLMEAEAANEA